VPPSRAGGRNRRRVRPLKTRILVCTEGRVTEPDYLNNLRRKLRQAPVAIEIDPAHGDPLFLVRRASEVLSETRRARRRGSANEGFDQVWCVVDVDDHPRLQAAKELAARESIPLVISNPCFEVWALLHFEECTAYLGRGDAARRLRAHIPEYEKALSTQLLDGKFALAKQRAVTLREFHQDGGVDARSNPSTEVFLLVDAIITVALAKGYQVDPTAL